MVLWNKRYLKFLPEPALSNNYSHKSEVLMKVILNLILTGGGTSGKELAIGAS